MAAGAWRTVRRDCSGASPQRPSRRRLVCCDGHLPSVRMEAVTRAAVPSPYRAQFRFTGVLGRDVVESGDRQPGKTSQEVQRSAPSSLLMKQGDVLDFAG